MHVGGSESCPMADFDIGGVELSCSATRQLINDVRETGCEED